MSNVNKEVLPLIDQAMREIQLAGIEAGREGNIRRILEQIGNVGYSAGKEDCLASLRTPEDAAIEWEVSRQRATLHIAKMHKRYGVGTRLGRIWVITQEDIELYKPDAHAPRPRFEE